MKQTESHVSHGHEPTDAALVELYQTHNVSVAYGMLATRHEVRVRQVLRALGVPEEQLKRVTVEVFVTAARRIRELRDPHNFAPWLLRLATSCAVSVTAN